MCGTLFRLLLFLVVLSLNTCTERIQPLDGVWQPVGETKHKFFVYSAYLEYRMMYAVRVIAITNTVQTDSVLCRLSLPDNRLIYVKAEVKLIFGNWDLEYSAAFVLCFLNHTRLKYRETINAVVSVISGTKPTSPPTNYLLVHDTRPRHSIERVLHVCVKPLHSFYSNDDWLTEWLEVHRLLGATHFYIYTESVSQSVRCLLDHYEKKGLLTTLQWKLPFAATEIRTEGHFASYNDCLYRSMSTAGWLLLVDLDEIIFPHEEKSLVILISKLQATKENKNKPSAYMFRNAFFYKQFKDDKQTSSSLLTARKTRRLKPNAIYDQSKYVVVPVRAVELGTHFVQQMIGDAFSAGISEKQALMHHYRETCKSGGAECLSEPSTLDRTAHSWTDALDDRVSILKMQTKKKCYKPNKEIQGIVDDGIFEKPNKEIQLVVDDLLEKNASDKRFYTLYNGYTIPSIALGTSLDHLDERKVLDRKYESADKVLQVALHAGFEHFDIENVYKDENEIGYAKDHMSVNRGDIFITAKLPNTAHEVDKVVLALEETLTRLRTSHVDLYLMQTPMAVLSNGEFSALDYVKTWRGMEMAVKMNLTRSIGVANLNLQQLNRLWNYAIIKPAVVEIEVNPTITQKDMIEWCHKKGVIVMAVNPLSDIFDHKKMTQPLRDDHPYLSALAKKYGKTRTQVLLRYLLDRSLIPVPATRSVNDIKKFIDVFDFALTGLEVEQLSKFNVNNRLRSFDKLYYHPHYPFKNDNFIPNSKIHEILYEMGGSDFNRDVNLREQTNMMALRGVHKDAVRPTRRFEWSVKNNMDYDVLWKRPRSYYFF